MPIKRSKRSPHERSDMRDSKMETRMSLRSSALHTCSIRPTAPPILPDGQFAHIRHPKSARRAILSQAASIDLARKSPAHSPRPAPDKRGASRSSRTLGAGCNGRKQHQSTSDVASGRQNRVVLTPRRWCQVPGKPASRG
jgi:hypothetical protein